MQRAHDLLLAPVQASVSAERRHRIASITQLTYYWHANQHLSSMPPGLLDIDAETPSILAGTTKSFPHPALRCPEPICCVRATAENAFCSSFSATRISFSFPNWRTTFSLPANVGGVVTMRRWPCGTAQFSGPSLTVKLFGGAGNPLAKFLPRLRL